MFSAGAADMAIDLGTVNTCIYTRGAVALNEPSVVAFNKVNGGVEAVGNEARDMFGRTPSNITPIWPVRNGVIADFEAVEKMLALFVKKARGRSYARAHVVIGVPAASTQVERRAVKDSVNRMRVRDVSLVDEPMAAAIGAGLPVTEPTGNMIIDIGGGTTDIAVVSLAGVVYASSLRLAGGDMDEAIISHLKRQHNLLIGHATAERIKCEIGSARTAREAVEDGSEGTPSVGRYASHGDDH
jgi:rod shape-determining protein MreB